MKNLAFASVLAGALLAPLSAQAQITIDQQWNKGSSATPTWQLVSQSFRPFDTTILRAGVWMDNQAARIVNGNLSVEVYKENGDLLTTGNANYSFAASDFTGRFVDVDLALVPVNPGDLYYLLFVSNEAVGSTGTTFFVDTCDTEGCDPGYAGGDYGEYNADTGNVDEYSNADLKFREFAAHPRVVATPEPASLVLLATGLVGVVGAARRRKVTSL